MALSRVWVYAQAADGDVAPITLEILTKARELGDTVECFYAGDDADAVAGVLGAHGATKVFTTGDLGGALQGAVPFLIALDYSSRLRDGILLGAVAQLGAQSGSARSRVRSSSSSSGDG